MNVYTVPSADTSGSVGQAGLDGTGLVGGEQRLVDVVEQDLVERRAGGVDDVEAGRLEHGADDDVGATPLVGSRVGAARRR